MKRLKSNIVILGLLALFLSACPSVPDNSVPNNPYAGGAQYPWEDNSGIAPLALQSGFLSDQSWASASNGWGPVEFNKSNGEQGAGDGNTIRINGKSYAKGLGVHASSRIQYDLSGQCQRFTADIGLDDEVRFQSQHGSVVFQVWSDGTKLYDSGTITTSSATKTIDLDLTGRGNLVLIVTDANGSNWYDHADWANAQVTCNPPTTNATLAYINVTDGMTISGSVRAPGVTVQNGTASKAVVEFRNTAGTYGWVNTLPTTPACAIGVCDWWDTTKVPNGDYFLKATVTLSSGQVLTGQVNFKIQNGGTTPPPPPPSAYLEFFNITNNQTLTGSVRAPGVNVRNGTANNVVIEFRNTSGTYGWVNTLPTTPACVIGVCDWWDTSRLANGAYYMKVTATLTGGQVLTGQVNFNISNGGATPPPPPPPPPTPPPPPPGGKVAWNQISSWGIQYQGFNTNQATAADILSNINVDLLVVGRFDGVGREWQASNISKVTAKRWILGYVSTGQAQTIEWYWQSWWREGNPWWIANPWDYSGTYNVLYWASEWQSLVFQTIDRIINAGFDGAFLDQSDPYWNSGFPGGPSTQNMLRSKELVCNIYNYANSKKPGFKIMVNGGGNQIDLYGADYWKCLDANAAEHLWYKNSGVQESAAYRDYTVPQLQKLVRAGKKVFTFDYTAVQSEINNVLSITRGYGFIPTVTDASVSTTPKVY